MNEQIIVVPELTVRVVTGETCYPGEGGFSSHSAETSPQDPELIEKLTTARQTKEKITLRCSTLDAIGTISNIRTEDDTKIFVLWVDDIIYRNPAKNKKSPTRNWSLLGKRRSS